MKKITIRLMMVALFGHCLHLNAQNMVIKNDPIQMYRAELEYEIPSELGEGAFWNYKTGKLWWVDIEKRTLNIYDPGNKKNRVIHVNQRIGTVVPDEQGNAMIALQSGIFQLDLASENMSLLCNPLQNKDSLRFNDGKCDPAGRLWVGSMHLKFVKGAASLYKIEKDGRYEEILRDVTISNGIIWSNDHRNLYYIDTPRRNVRAWDYEKETGKISNERIVVEIPDGMGGPDGMTIDNEGKLWIAHWGGNMVGRWDPDTGQLLGKVEVPAPNVTSCAFGGPDLDILYITTAGGGRDEYPQAGSIFSVKTDSRGVKGSFFDQ